MSPLLDVTLLFAKLSLLAVGGANATVPEIARQVVGQRHWFTPGQFAALYAISNAAPGPNVMISTIIGAQRAGVAGGVLATCAMVLPAATLAALTAHFFAVHREARWRRATQAALMPLMAGLVCCAAVVLSRQADTGWLTAALTLGCAVTAYKTRTHPLLLFATGAVLGALFL